MAKIWQKNYDLDKLIEEFTVGRDYLLDQSLVRSDCAASAAHARMLHSINILSETELSSLISGLNRIIDRHIRNDFPIKRESEDCHTAIEEALTESAGDAGKKIHTGRSRNDQVITAIRLYMRSFVVEQALSLTALCRTIIAFAEKHKDVPMPGRTHFQTGMPSSVALWAASFAEELADLAEQAKSLFYILDQNPLGSAASYGVSLPLDREMTAKLMGFSRVQNNVLYVQNTRGKFESMVLDWCDQAGLTFSKIAADLIVFSVPEFGYFSLPKALCSGSSIMPQKKNPDGLELTRAKSATLTSYNFQVRSIIRSLPTGYNRDFQETKEPLLNGCSLVSIMTKIINQTFESLEVNEQNLKAGFTPDIFATDAAYEKVLAGESFRDAYVDVGLNLDQLKGRDPVSTISNRTHTGSAGNLGLEKTLEASEACEKWFNKEKERIGSALNDLLGRSIDLL